MRELQSLLKQYHVKPHYIEEIGRVYKLYTWDGVYALKKLGEDNRKAMNLYETFAALEKNKVYHKVPIIPTIGRKMFSTDGKSLYYLMPWIEVNETHARESLIDLFKAAAILHGRTVREERFSSEERKKMYQFYMKRAEERQAKMIHFLERCEKQIYMSPYELNYCLHFHELMRLDEIAKQKLKKWYEITADKKKERVSICHGNLRLDHLVYYRNHKPYLINFERSFVGTPIIDLKYLVETHFYKHPSSRKSMLIAMKTYERLHPLTEDEKLMLAWRLLQMELVEAEIHRYRMFRHEKKELKRVKKLQKIVWLKQNVSHFMYEYFEKKSASTDQSKSTST